MLGSDLSGRRKISLSGQIGEASSDFLVFEVLKALLN
jgi:hypothetical protein